MKYMGSKSRIAKDILPIMLQDRLPGQWWVEPFVGGGNIIDKVTGNRLGADMNPYVIEALIAIRDHVEQLPQSNAEFTEADYNNLLQSDYPFKGYAGFAFSYAAKWRGGWCRDRERRRDYVAEAYRNALKQSPKLQGVILKVSSYQELEMPPNSIIYCDPPYAHTTQYKVEFNHAQFWDWCRHQRNSGHTIYISEYTAPKDFECIWEKEINSSLTKDTGSKTGIEKLFQ